MTRESSEDARRVHVYLSGKVQGVFFRDSAGKKAEDLGLSGWVQNLPDGRVEVVFEGPSPSVGEMLDWCSEGPSRASVEDVQTEDLPPEGGSGGFEVR